METLKVCKECGKSGSDLHLNESLLCNECAEAQKMIMAHDEFRHEVISTWESGGDLSKLEAYTKAYDKVLSDQRDRTLKSHEYVYNNLMKGKALEKQGKADEALALYFENLKYLPQGTDYYTRPCIVLEKKKEYDKAIEVCDLAIEVIEEGRFNADVEEFINRKNRLLAKKAKAERERL